MKIVDAAVYRGANSYAPVSVVRFRLDVGGRVEGLDGAVRAVLRAHLPALVYPREAPAPPSAGSVFGRTVGALHAWLGFRTDTFVERPGPRPGLVDVACASVHPRVAGAVGELAARIVDAAGGAAERSSGLPAALDEVQTVARASGLVSSAVVLLPRLAQRDIPWRWVSEHVPLLQLGLGRRRRIVSGAATGETGYLAAGLSNNKLATARLLQGAGLPVPEARPVHDESQAAAAATDLGFPIVIKPNGSNWARGVQVGLSTVSQVRAAFGEAAALGTGVLVQRHVVGREYRLLAIAGRFVAAYERCRGSVVGDGDASVGDLIDRARAQWRARDAADDLRPIAADADAQRQLAARGYTYRSIPAAGEEVILRLRPGRAGGGRSIDVSRLAHREVRRMAERAAALIGLDVAGLDYVSPDIARPWQEGGVILEVNHSPRIRNHVVADGDPPDVIGALLDTLYPDAAPSRIPLAVIAGAAGADSVAVQIDRALAGIGLVTGLSTAAGVTVGGELVIPGPTPVAAAAQAAVMDPGVDAAVLVAQAADVERDGLGLDACSVTTLVGEGPADLEGGLGVLVAAARCGIVVDAGERRAAELVAALGAGRVCLVGTEAEADRLRRHADAGHRVLLVEAGAVRLLEGRVETQRLELLRPLREGPSLRHWRLAAATATWLGVELQQLAPPTAGG